MGDRANVILKQGREKVVLYAHWTGYKIPGQLQAAMKRGRDRWGDMPYLARIVFCEMIRGNIDGITGFGISNQVGDDDRPLIKLDIDKHIISFGKYRYGFDEFLSAKLPWTE